MKESVKGKKQHSMKWKLIGILMLCWLIPFSVMFGVMVVYVATNHSDMTAQNFQQQLAFNNKICMERINGAVASSRQASYDGELLQTNDMAKRGSTTALLAGRKYKTYLADHYQKNDAVSCAFLWFLWNKEEVYSVYNEQAFGSYQKVRAFQNEDFETISAYAESLGTKVGFLYENGRLYLVRNMVDSRFQEQGVLVFLLNQNYCFNSLTEYPSGDGVYVRLNEERMELDPQEQLSVWLDENGDDGSVKYDWDKGRLYVTDVQKGDNYKLYSTMQLEKVITQYPFYGYQYVMSGMFLCLIPLLMVVLWVFQKEVTIPVAILSEGAGRIENGEVGYQIEQIPNNYEFAYLRNSMNEMSAHLKEQFDRILQEEIALREARIMALQSHINPHFMNNTLEIINWEARLSGNEKVSRMIEALATMMDAAMDRKKRPEVRLAEEMRYVNSYLYITKERLGKRLSVETDIPQELMSYYVPRLILQPVVENAVEHGVVPNGSGTVVIKGYIDEKYLYLETINNGGLTTEDKEKIARLLDPGYSREKEAGGNMGIANVNQRLRILFGEPCGLTLEENQKGSVVARIIVPLRRSDAD